MREDAEPAQRALASFLERARALGLDVRGLAFVSMSPADDIVRIAEAKNASMILLGAHAPWWLEGRLDGLVRDVIRRANRSVGVLVGAERPLPSDEFRRILVAHAGREDDPALAAASRLARRGDARVVVLSIRTPGGTDGDVTPAHGYIVRAVRALDAASALVSAVEQEGADLIVVARAERWRLSGDRMGRSRKSLYERVDAPLLVVHDGGAAAGAPDPAEVMS
jgi:nucleotide-binding universal stress UspA family protein